MNQFLLRLLILGASVAVAFAGYILVQANIARRKRIAMAAPATDVLQRIHTTTIIAFHTDDCRQCFTMQAPVLQKIQRERGENITVWDVDAIAESELAKRFEIMTVPSTVVIDAQGATIAINYGFADSTKLNKQLDMAPGLSLTKI